MRSIWLRRLNNLLCVKKHCDHCFNRCVCSPFSGRANFQPGFFDRFSVIVAFYFGIQNEKQEELPEKEAEKLSAQK